MHALKWPIKSARIVVAMKGSWPPTSAQSVETIASSFVPPTSGSGKLSNAWLAWVRVPVDILGHHMRAPHMYMNISHA